MAEYSYSTVRYCAKSQASIIVVLYWPHISFFWWTSLSVSKNKRLIGSHLTGLSLCPVITTEAAYFYYFCFFSLVYAFHIFPQLDRKVFDQSESWVRGKEMVKESPGIFWVMLSNEELGSHKPFTYMFIFNLTVGIGALTVTFNASGLVMNKCISIVIIFSLWWFNHSPSSGG